MGTYRRIKYNRRFSAVSEMAYNICMNMIIHQNKHEKVAELITDAVIINKVQDAISIMEELFATGAHKIIIHKENIAPEFFDLSTRLAGEVLQKFVNYNLQLAIVGDYSKITSEALKAFIYESNKGNQIFFVDGVEMALQKLQCVDQELMD
jgi:hypothetical protein